jgi:hypothetical protein
MKERPCVVLVKTVSWVVARPTVRESRLVQPHVPLVGTFYGRIMTEIEIFRAQNLRLTVHSHV